MHLVRTHKINSSITDRNIADLLLSIVKRIPGEYLKQQRWFGSKSHDIKGIELHDAAITACQKKWYVFALIRVNYTKIESELYSMPLAILRKDDNVIRDSQDLPILEIESPDGSYMVKDALADDEFCRLQFEYIDSSMPIDARYGKFKFMNTSVLCESRYQKLNKRRLVLKHLKTEQSNTSTIYQDTFIMKNFRKLSPGINPDLEVPLFLTTRTEFKDIARVAGYIEYTDTNNLSTSVASLQTFVPNSGDGWNYTLQHLDMFYKYVLKKNVNLESTQRTGKDIEIETKKVTRNYLKNIHRLGQVTGELHVALASCAEEQGFAPEEISMSDVISWSNRMKSYGIEVINSLDEIQLSLESRTLEQLRKVIDNISLYLHKVDDLSVLAEQKVWKIRYHNDYHLGQVLKTKTDFIIIDFEGEPARPLTERREKHSPIKDVAGMLRSFNYATYAAIFNMKVDKEHSRLLEKWGKVWEELVRQSFLNGYLDIATGAKARFLPDSMKVILRVLSVFQMDKAIYELNYEINNRPTWVEIPLKYLISLLDQ